MVLVGGASRAGVRHPLPTPARLGRRALVVVCREPGDELDDLREQYLSFVLAAQAPDGRFHNRRQADLTWPDTASVEDCWGRALWGLGTAQYFSEDWPVAVDTFRAAEEALSAGDDEFMQGWVLHMLGTTEIRLGQLDSALGHIRGALVNMRAAGETTGLVLVLDDFADYAWDSNKGYGSAAHWAGIERVGPSPLHRVTWLSKSRESAKEAVPASGPVGAA